MTHQNPLTDQNPERLFTVIHVITIATPDASVLSQVKAVIEYLFGEDKVTAIEARPDHYLAQHMPYTSLPAHPDRLRIRGCVEHISRDSLTISAAGFAPIWGGGSEYTLAIRCLWGQLRMDRYREEGKIDWVDKCGDLSRYLI